MHTRFVWALLALAAGGCNFPTPPTPCSVSVAGMETGDFSCECETSTSSDSKSMDHAGIWWPTSKKYPPMCPAGHIDLGSSGSIGPGTYDLSLDSSTAWLEVKQVSSNDNSAANLPNLLYYFADKDHGSARLEISSAVSPDVGGTLNWVIHGGASATMVRTDPNTGEVVHEISVSASF
jgi:hypothetical protein